LREESFEDANAQRLLAAFTAEITALYPSWNPDIGPSARAEDFRPPGGKFIVAYVNEDPVACGGLKHLDSDTAEVKRLYVCPNVRGRGLGRRMLGRLEREALTAGCAAVRLDTGSEQPRAVGLFAAAGYREIPDYNGNPVASLWFEKRLRGF